MACTKVKAKNALRPMLGACAKGNFDMKANNSVDIADMTAVVVNKAALSMPVVASIDGLTAKI